MSGLGDREDTGSEFYGNTRTSTKNFNFLYLFWTVEVSELTCASLTLVERNCWRKEGGL